MVAVGEILLNAFLQVLFDRLASCDLLSFVHQLGGGFDSKLKKRKKKLKMIQAVLCDAEEKQLTDEAVKMWLDNLQDLAHDAEDILYDSSGQVLSFIPASLNTNAIRFNYSVRSKINDITSRLEQLCQRIELELQRIAGGASSTADAAHQRPPSSSVPSERQVFGREEDKAKILVTALTDTSSDHANFVVIRIVGMGGIGKTTLARKVYDDKGVEDSQFDIKAWVCVSNVFDVWADQSLWVDLKAPFLAAASNSQLIVRTRHPYVASTMGPIDDYNLKSLLMTIASPFL